MLNRKLKVKHVKTDQNILVDSLSYLNFKRFWRYALDDTDPALTEMPEVIWPMEKIWFDQ